MATMTAGAPTGLSFEEVRRLHAAAVYRLCIVAVGHPVAAEETAAHVLSVASAAIAVDRPVPRTALRWLCGIACEVIVEEAPRRRPWHRPPPAVATGWGKEVDAALVAAARLPLRGRLAAALRCAAGLTYEEIGGILGLRPEEARALCLRGMRRLRAGAR